MASIITLGLSSIVMGDIAVDGGPGTVLTSLGYTYENSAKMSQDEPEVQEYFAEESEYPVVRKPNKKKTTFMFQLMNVDAAGLMFLMGGTITAGPPKVWNAPAVTPLIEKTVKITPQQGHTITIPRGSITAKIVADFGRSGLFLVDVMVTPQQPTKAGVAPFTATEPA